MTKKSKIIDNGIKILDSGIIPPGGRIAQQWSQMETELIKFTRAETFNKKVQTESGEFISYFGFKGVEFGNWMSQADRLEFIYGAAHAFEALRKFLGIPAKYIGLGGELSIAFGARGKGGALAHYEPKHKVINITKPHGESGSLFHEYAHAVDNLVYQLIRSKHESNLINIGFVSGGFSVSKGIDLDRLQRDDLIGLMENIFASLYWNLDGSKKKWLEDFQKHENSEYWHRRNEIFARSSEVWCSLLARKLDINNKMLIAKKYETVVYPPANVISPIFDDFKLFFERGIKFVNGNGSYRLKVVESIPKIDKNKSKNDTQNDKKKTAVSKSKTKILAGNVTEIDTQNETLKAKYALIELDKLIQSNDPITFKPNPDYPASCQTRNYNEIKGEQEKVIKYSSNFKPSHLVNNSPDATTGSPIVTDKGIVLGGNGRTMILKRLSQDNWSKYEKLLTQKVNDFGIKKHDLGSFKKPVLVRLLENVSISKCSYYSDTLNSNTMQDFDPVTKSISIAKSMDTATFERIANIFEDTEGETFSQVLSIPTASKKIVELLTDKKFINTSNRDVWLDGNDLSSKGKETLENVLLAYILPDKKLIEKAKVYTNKIVKALPLLVKIKQFKSSWNLIPDIQKVIELENSRRSTGQTKTDYLNQDDIFNKGKNPTVSEKEKLVWSLLDSGVLKFKEALASYIRTYENENSENAMFGGGNATPIEVLENLKSVKGLSDKFRAVEARRKKGKQTHAKPRKKRTTAKYEGEKLSDKPSKTKKAKKKVRLTILDRTFGVTK